MPRGIEAAAEPFLSLRRVPQRLVERPGVTAIPRQEQAAGNRPAPDQARLIGAAALQTEQVRHARPILVSFNLRESRCRNLLPVFAVVRRALQLDAEMAERLRGIERAIARVQQEHGNRIAEKGGPCDLPSFPFSANIEEPFARSDEQPIAHDPTPSAHPPVST
jgi:hypothetical protein